MPGIIPDRHGDLVSLLRAARHVQRYNATDTTRGRPGRWKREDLLRVAASLGEILERGTASKVSFSSFVDHYLRLPDFPADVIEALERGEINLFEAEQLARLTAKRLASKPGRAKRLRAELLRTHLQTKESGPGLRRRVNELLRPSAKRGTQVDAHVEDFDDLDPYDSTHLFWDQIRQLGFALREIRREDVEEEEIEQLLDACAPVLTLLARIQRRKERKAVSN